MKAPFRSRAFLAQARNARPPTGDRRWTGGSKTPDKRGANEREREVFAFDLRGVR